MSVRLNINLLRRNHRVLCSSAVYVSVTAERETPELPAKGAHAPGLGVCCDSDWD